MADGRGSSMWMAVKRARWQAGYPERAGSCGSLLRKSLQQFPPMLRVILSTRASGSTFVDWKLPSNQRWFVPDSVSKLVLTQ